MPQDNEYEKAREHREELGEIGDKILKWGEGLVILAGGATAIEFAREFFSEHLLDIFNVDSVVWKFSIVIYFTSWLFGVEVDKRRQLRVYRFAPKQAKAHISLIIISYTLALLFVLMVVGEELTMLGQAKGTTTAENTGYLAQLIHFWITDRDEIYRNGFRLFLAAINVLWLLNIIGWIGYLHYVINPIASYCKEIYEKEPDPYSGLEKINVEERYIKGKWQIARFLVGTVLLVALDATFYRISHGLAATNKFQNTLAFSLAILGYIGVIEIWVWSRRLRAGAAIRSIETLSTKYSFRSRGNENSS